MPRSLIACFVAEVIGTFILVFLGCGAVHSGVLTGGLSGLWQVGIIWGIAIMLAAHSIGTVSGAHINPAMTIAMAVYRGFPWNRVPAYILAQMLGAFLAAAALFGFYRSFLDEAEKKVGASRGDARSVVTAMCYGEYYPNPGALNSSLPSTFDSDAAALFARMTTTQAFLAELLATAVLAWVVFAVTDPRNAGGPAERFAPVFIGLTVATLICVVAPLTQACFNPARDFGPRLFAYFAGWGATAIPGPNGSGFFTVYVVAPTIGALCGGAAYKWFSVAETPAMESSR